MSTTKSETQPLPVNDTAAADQCAAPARSNLNAFFPHKVCINLDRRADRWRRITARFAAHSIAPVERFAAFDGTTLDIPPGWPEQAGAYACLQSHLKVVEEASARALPSILIFEDDAVFAPDFNAKFQEYARQVPGDWDMLLLGGIHIAPPVAVAAHLSKIKHTYSTFAYALKHTIYDAFIELNRRALTTVDDNNRTLQKRFNCYSFMPHLAWVEEDFSDIRGETQSHWWLKESLVLWGSHMDEVLNRTAAIIHYRAQSAESGRNLRFIIDYYARQLPGLAVLIIETANAPTLDPAQLPRHCRYQSLPETAPNDHHAAAFDAGIRACADRKDFFICADSRLFIERDDLRANLLQCLSYDFVTSFGSASALSVAETERIHKQEIRWDTDAEARLAVRGMLCGGSDDCGIITKRGWQLIGGWQGTDAGGGAELISERVRRRLRVYESPNRARRLYESRDIGRLEAS